MDGLGISPLLNFYTFCSTRGSIPIVPDFVGYYKRLNWPLDEEYAKTALILYKPFNCSEDDLKGDKESFAQALLEFMSDPVFPRSVEAEICRKKQRYKYVPEEGDDYQAGGVESTPNEDEREHQLNEEAQATKAANVPVDDDSFVDDIQDAQFNEDDLSGFDRGLNLDWSEGYTESGCSYLVDHTKLYYARQHSAAYNQPFSLFDPKVYIPENCQGFAQTFLVCMTLHIVKQYTEKYGQPRYYTRYQIPSIH
jgi:hypothetical protein